MNEHPFGVGRCGLLVASGGIHLAAAAVTLLRPHLWPWAAAGTLANHGLLAALSVMPRSTLLGPNLNTLRGRPGWGDRVALTFDDGPDPAVTPKVLSLLAERGARASFFCVGDRVRRHPQIARAIVEQGHGVENHTAGHSWAFAFCGRRRAARDIESASEAIVDATGRRPHYFRPPAGIRNPWMAPVIRAAGLRLVSWTRRGFDAVDTDPSLVIARLTRDLAAGDILVLHDGYGPRRHDGMPVVLETLPRLLDALDAADLAASRLPDPSASTSPRT